MSNTKTFFEYSKFVSIYIHKCRLNVNCTHTANNRDVTARRAEKSIFRLFREEH